jgi:hypothetical protein
MFSSGIFGYRSTAMKPFVQPWLNLSGKLQEVAHVVGAGLTRKSVL